MTPMAPHIACELWEVISRGTGVVVQQGDGKESAMTSSGTQYNTSLNALQQSWPVPDASVSDKVQSVEIAVQVRTI